VLVAAPQLAIAGLSYRVWRAGDRLHPDRFGKIAMALVWVALAGIVLINIILPPGGTASWLSYVLAAGAALAGLATYWGYRRSPM
jgi:hypothetical protein